MKEKWREFASKFETTTTKWFGKYLLINDYYCVRLFIIFQWIIYLVCANLCREFIFWLHIANARGSNNEIPCLCKCRLNGENICRVKWTLIYFRAAFNYDDNQIVLYKTGTTFENISECLTGRLIRYMPLCNNYLSFDWNWHLFKYYLFIFTSTSRRYWAISSTILI